MLDPQPGARSWAALLSECLTRRMVPGVQRQFWSHVACILFPSIPQKHTRAHFSRVHVHARRIPAGALWEPQFLHLQNGVNKPFAPGDCGDGIGGTVKGQTKLLPS